MGGSGSGWPPLGGSRTTIPAKENLLGASQNGNQNPKNIIIIMTDGLGADYIHQYRQSKIEGVLAVNFNFIANQGIKVTDCICARPPRTESGIASMFLGKPTMIEHGIDPYQQIAASLKENENLFTIAVQHQKFLFNLLPRTDSGWLTKIDVVSQNRFDVLLWESWENEKKDMLSKHSKEFKIDPSRQDLIDLKNKIKRQYPTKSNKTPFSQLKSLSGWVHDSALMTLQHLIKNEPNGVVAFIHDPTVEFLGHWCDEEAYREGIRDIDDFIGRIITLLREEDKYENTLLLIVGDHGMTFNTDNHLERHSDISQSEVKYVPFLFNQKLKAAQSITDISAVLRVVKEWLGS